MTTLALPDIHEPRQGAIFASPGEFGGVHCETSAVRKVLLASGVDITEATLFGLGGGPGFWYAPSAPGGTVRSMTSTRNGPFPTFLMRMSQALGIDVHINRTRDRGAAQDGLVAQLAAGTPVVCYADIFHLPYFQASRHFGGHAIIVFGIDLEASQVWISDRSPRPIVLSTEQLATARSSDAQPFSPENAWLTADWSHARRPDEQTLRHAIRSCVRALSQTTAPHEGHLGMLAWGTDLGRVVRRAPTPDVIDRLVASYTDFEFAGTGGSGFRNLYRRFLLEASATIADDALHEAHVVMDVVCERWEHLTGLLLPMWGPELSALRVGYLTRQISLITGTEASLVDAAEYTAAVPDLQAAAAAALDTHRDRLAEDLTRAVRSLVAAERELVRHLSKL